MWLDKESVGEVMVALSKSIIAIALAVFIAMAIFNPQPKEEECSHVIYYNKELLILDEEYTIEYIDSFQSITEGQVVKVKIKRKNELKEK